MNLDNCTLNAYLTFFANALSSKSVTGKWQCRLPSPLTKSWCHWECSATGFRRLCI